MISSYRTKDFKYLNSLSEQVSLWQYFKTSKRTSSRVGEIIKAPSPSIGPHFCRYRVSSTGIRNARVFPLPVRAAPSTSFPLSDTGILWAWMSVMFTKNAFFKPRFVFSDIGRSEKAFKPSGTSYFATNY